MLLWAQRCNLKHLFFWSKVTLTQPQLSKFSTIWCDCGKAYCAGSFSLFKFTVSSAILSQREAQTPPKWKGTLPVFHKSLWVQSLSFEYFHCPTIVSLPFSSTDDKLQQSLLFSNNSKSRLILVNKLTMFVIQVVLEYRWQQDLPHV